MIATFAPLRPQFRLLPTSHLPLSLVAANVINCRFPRRQKICFCKMPFYLYYTVHFFIWLQSKEGWMFPGKCKHGNRFVFLAERITQVCETHYASIICGERKNKNKTVGDCRSDVNPIWLKFETTFGYCKPSRRLLFP